MKKQKMPFIIIILAGLFVAGIFTMKKMTDAVLPVFNEDDWL